MNPSTATDRGAVSRLVAKWTDWLMRVFGRDMRPFVRDLFVPATIAIIYVAGTATAAIAPVDLGGRWLAKQHKLTLDVARCDNGWCGVEVTNGNSCGRTVLWLDAGAQRTDDVQFIGRLQLAAQTEPYGVNAILLRRGDVLTLRMSGHTGGMFQAARRTFDFRDVFARTGVSSCKPDAKVS